MSLDGDIARQVFGYYRDGMRPGPFTDWHEPDCGGPGLCRPECGFTIRSYSTDISAAMKVVEKLRAVGWSFACTLYEGKLPYASFCKQTAASSKNAEGQSLPEAICRAALQALDEGQ